MSKYYVSYIHADGIAIPSYEIIEYKGDINMTEENIKTVSEKIKEIKNVKAVIIMGITELKE